MTIQTSNSTTLNIKVKTKCSEAHINDTPNKEFTPFFFHFFHSLRVSLSIYKRFIEYFYTGNINSHMKINKRCTWFRSPVLPNDSGWILLMNGMLRKQAKGHETRAIIAVAAKRWRIKIVPCTSLQEMLTQHSRLSRGVGNKTVGIISFSCAMWKYISF